MTDYVAQARELMEAIRYQVFVPEATTVSSCPRQGCDNSGRGGRSCRHCLSKDLNALLPGTIAGSYYLESCQALRRAERSVLHDAENKK